jgi:predicted adenine nucleotide alpha hydrolase (AANH) superfamily ATPase
MTDKTKGFSFKTANKNVLTEDKKPTFQKDDNIQPTSNIGRRPKKPEESIVKKISLTLNEGEYSKFKQEFLQSGFPSESSFLKFLVKKYGIV